MILTILAFIFVLGLLVLVHEFGHFIAARRSGVKVEEFAFGFPPRIAAIKRGETRYVINLIPIGGYCKLFGEGGEDRENIRSFAHKTFGQKIWILTFGVLMNFILAAFLFMICFWAGMAPLVGHPENYKWAKVQKEVLVVEILPGSVAELAGIKVGDRILKIDQSKIQKTDDLVGYTKARPNQKVTILYQKGDQEKEIGVTLGEKEGKGMLGVILVDNQKISFPFYLAPFIAIWETVKMVLLVFKLFILLIVDLIVSRKVPSDVAGPVGIFKFTGQAVHLGLIYLLQFTAFLSINLGIINILPFPALDGGRALFVVIEKVRKKRITPAIENTVHLIGFAILILLIILITFRDIIRLR